MSSLGEVRSAPSEEAVSGRSALWRAIKVGRLSAAGAAGPRLAGRSILARALSRITAAAPLGRANAALQHGDYATALALARPLADRGLPVAQLVVGVMYGGGHGVAQNDAEAANWLHRAADQGCPEAQTILGAMYARGQGLSQNDAKAVKWFRMAAERDHAAAQSNLGLMYAQGRGVTQNDAEAAKWLRKAADQGLVEAQTLLGLIYVKGQGVTQDYILAHMWLNRAAAQGDAGALADRDQLARMMTPAQIAEAQRRAQERTSTK